MVSPPPSPCPCLRAGVVSIGLLVVACAPPPPVDRAAAPRGDPLLLFLRTSPAARAVADAARDRGLLSGAEPAIAELEFATRSLQIDDLGELESRVEAVLDDVPALFASLEGREPGSKRGDVAHWVAVALVGLDEGPAREEILRAEGGWDGRYLEALLELRRMHDEGSLGPPKDAPAADEVAPGSVAVDRPDGSGLSLALSFEPELRPEVVADRDVPAWPVFPSPGARQVVAVVPLEQGRALSWDRLLVRVRRPGRVGVGKEPVAAPRFRLGRGGRLIPDGETTVEAGRRLDLLVDLRPGGGYALVGDGRVVELPRGCCPVLEPPEAEWWVRLSGGEGDGGWVVASAAPLGLRMAGTEARMDRMARPGDADRPGRLGELRGTGTLEVAGAELIYWLAGNDDAPALVVLHGGPGLGSRYLQNPLLRTLGYRRRLVFYDQRGSGYSEGAAEPSRLTVRRSVFDLDAIRIAAGRERIDLLGHSFGGLLALHYALEYPDHVGKLVLVDPDPASRALWVTFEERLARRTTPPDAARLAEITSAAGWEEDPETMTDWLRTRLRAYVARPQDVEELEIRFDETTLRSFRVTRDAVRDDLGDWDLHARLEAVTAPTLIVAGGDSIFPIAAMEALERALPAARLRVIDGVGHFPFVEAPDRFAAEVLSFLEGR